MVIGLNMVEPASQLLLGQNPPKAITAVPDAIIMVWSGHMGQCAIINLSVAETLLSRWLLWRGEAEWMGGRQVTLNCGDGKLCVF